MSLQARFGNLTREAFEKRVETNFAQSDRKWLDDHRTDKADFQDADKFHIFDMPLGIVAGSGIFDELLSLLKKKNEYKDRFYVEKKEVAEATSPDLPF